MSNYSCKSESEEFKGPFKQQQVSYILNKCSTEENVLVCKPESNEVISQITFTDDDSKDELTSSCNGN